METREKLSVEKELDLLLKTTLRLEGELENVLLYSEAQ